MLEQRPRFSSGRLGFSRNGERIMKLVTLASTLSLCLFVTACVNDGGYSGCNGVGCTVDNPDAPRRVERSPRSEKPSNRGYDGCNGIGCAVDKPDDPEKWPLCSDGARHPDCSYAPEGY